MSMNLRKASVMIDIIMPLSLFLIFYPPCLVWYASELMFVIYLLQKGLFFLAACYAIKYKIFQNVDLWLLIGYIIWIIIVTVIQRNPIGEIGIFLNLFSWCIISIYCLERNPRKFTGCAAFYFTALIFLNTLLWKEEGMYVSANGQLNFVLGTKTCITEYQIVACGFIGMYYALLPKKKKRNAISLLTILVLSVIVWNVRQPISTSAVCMVVFIGLFMAQNIQNMLVDIALKVAFWVANALNLGIIFFNAQMLFASFITDVLHESVELDSRTYIWKVVIAKISESPIIGHGLNSNTFFSIDEGISAINQSTHNGLLNFLFIGGIVGTVYIMLLCFRLLRNVNIKTLPGRIFCVMLACFALFWISEQTKGYVLFYSCLILGVCISCIDQHCIENQV